MNKIEEAEEILSALGMGKVTISTPYCLLSLAGIKKGDAWSSATSSWQTIRTQMDFMSKNYRKNMLLTPEKAFESKVCIH